MLEIKKVSPLLDEFALGKPFSDRFGVVCYPAVHSGTNEKFILKRISIPENQTKADALVLTGACVDKVAAQTYFEELAQNMVAEIGVLKALSQTRGFAPFYDHQLTPKEKGQVGMDLWLLSPYRTTLAAYMRRGSVTHLEAVNLGIDICAALTLCRKAGYLYQNVRPENIYITPQRKFQLGDLGLLSLDELSYAMLPDHCRSAYTPPELYDAMAEPNETMDLYALGMVLYCVYNEGKLPGDGDSFPGEFEPIPAPVHAHEEMAQIILKAIDYKRENRWQSPEEMGQALVAYMQSNTVNDEPIGSADGNVQQEQQQEEAQEESQAHEPEQQDPDFTPEPELGFTPTEPELTQEEMEAGRITTAKEAQMDTPPVEDAELADILSRAEQFMDEEGAAKEGAAKEGAVEESTAEEAAAEESDAEEATAEDAVEEADVEEADVEEATAEETVAEEAGTVETAAEEDTVEEVTAEDGAAAENAEEAAQTEERTEEEQSAQPEISTEAEETEEAAPAETEQAEEVEQEAAAESGEQTTQPVLGDEDEEEVVIPHLQPLTRGVDEAEEDEELEDEDGDGFQEEKMGILKKIVAGLCVLICLGLMCMGGYYYYQNIYCMPISRFEIQESTLNSITVDVQVRGQEELLVLSCRDNFGNAYRAYARNGQATFEGLQPNTQYMITLSVDGFHQLLGNDTLSHTTAIQTEITSFTAVTGAEDGSVDLSFEADGTLPDEWTVTYEAYEEQKNSVTFQGDSVVITGLTVGKNYTFTLTAGKDASGNSIYLSGNDVLEYTAMPVVTAQNITVSAYDGKAVTLSWDAPQVEVGSWTIRCYNSDGTDLTKETKSNSIIFRELDSSKAYSFEITAQDMTQSSVFAITSNPVFIRGIQVDDKTPGKLTVSWDFAGNAPEKWLVMYSCSEDPTAMTAVQTEEASITLEPFMPKAHYDFQFQPADGSTAFGSLHAVDTASWENLSDFGITNADISGYAFPAPEKDNWALDDVDPETKTDTFKTGATIGFALEITSKYEYVDDEVYTMIVVRNEAGEPVDYTHGSARWHTMWTKDQYMGELPRTPQTPGKYTVEVYFNYTFACEIPITVVE